MCICRRICTWQTVLYLADERKTTLRRRQIIQRKKSYFEIITSLGFFLISELKRNTNGIDYKWTANGYNYRQLLNTSCLILIGNYLLDPLILKRAT